MSVLIKGMEMPKDGVYWCEIGVAGDIATITIHGEERKSFPLVSVPEPHGRLIDADALNYTMLYKENWMRGTGIEAPAVWRKDIDAAPTIIPASGEG